MSYPDWHDDVLAASEMDWLHQAVALEEAPSSSVRTQSLPSVSSLSSTHTSLDARTGIALTAAPDRYVDTASGTDGGTASLDGLFGRRITWDTSDDLSARLSGDALALGTDTYANADIDLTARDLGLISLVTGTAVVTAAARDDGADPVALVETAADVAGADLVIVSRHVFTGTTETADGTVVGEEEVLRVLAVDFEFFDFADGPIRIERTREFDSAPDPSLLDGNVAAFDVGAEAFADVTGADVEVSATTLEDALSQLTAIAEVLLA